MAENPIEFGVNRWLKPDVQRRAIGKPARDRDCFDPREGARLDCTNGLRMIGDDGFRATKSLADFASVLKPQLAGANRRSRGK
jgi:hypothetical protein